MCRSRVHDVRISERAQSKMHVIVTSIRMRVEVKHCSAFGDFLTFIFCIALLLIYTYPHISEWLSPLATGSWLYD
jgi:hypothetical protein